MRWWCKKQDIYRPIQRFFSYKSKMKCRSATWTQNELVRDKYISKNHQKYLLTKKAKKRFCPPTPPNYSNIKIFVAKLYIHHNKPNVLN